MFWDDSRAARISLTVWTARTYVLDICVHSGQDLLGKLRVLLGKWRWSVGQTKCIVADKHLAVAHGSGANADGRYLHGPGNSPRQIRWDRFEHDGKDAGLLQHLRIFR